MLYVTHKILFIQSLIMDDLISRLSRCSIKSHDSMREINSCEYCGQNISEFISAPYCDFIGIFVCGKPKCKSYAMGDIYEYCIMNSHYPITPNIISKFFNDMTILHPNGYIINNLSARPYSFTYIENKEIIIVVANDGSNSFVVPLEKICEWNNLDMQIILSGLKHELDNFDFV